MQTLHALPATFRAGRAEAMAQQHIDGLLKPPGSLGRLETFSRSARGNAAGS